MECPVCLESKLSIPLLSCGHPLCDVCLPRLNKRICPLCRSPFGKASEPNWPEEEEVTADSVTWEDIEAYPFDFSVQVNTRTSRMARRTHPRRRAQPRRTTGVRLRPAHAVPAVLSDEVVTTILSELDHGEGASTITKISAVGPDDRKQSFHHNRGRWREHMAHRGRIT